MQTKKFLGLVVGLCSLQVYAMEEPVNQQMVQAVVVQVHPRYIPQTQVFTPLPLDAIREHEDALSVLSTRCDALYLAPVRDLGIYHLSLKKELAFAAILALCKSVPGFEQLHDAQEYHDSESNIKEALLEYRLKQLEEVRVKQLEEQEEVERKKREALALEERKKEEAAQERIRRLEAYKGLSHKSSQLVVAK